MEYLGYNLVRAEHFYSDAHIFLLSPRKGPALKDSTTVIVRFFPDVCRSFLAPIENGLFLLIQKNDLYEMIPLVEKDGIYDAMSAFEQYSIASFEMNCEEEDFIYPMQEELLVYSKGFAIGKICREELEAYDYDVLVYSNISCVKGQDGKLGLIRMLLRKLELSWDDFYSSFKNIWDKYFEEEATLQDIQEWFYKMEDYKAFDSDLCASILNIHNDMFRYVIHNKASVDLKDSCDTEIHYELTARECSEIEQFISDVYPYLNKNMLKGYFAKRKFLGL